jgi:hypothetical protein
MAARACAIACCCNECCHVTVTGPKTLAGVQSRRERWLPVLGGNRVRVLFPGGGSHRSQPQVSLPMQLGNGLVVQCGKGAAATSVQERGVRECRSPRRSP